MITLSAFADEIAQDLQTQMDVCEANGVFCIDVRNLDGKNVSKLTLAEVAAYRRRMDDRGFIVPCIGSPIGKIRMDESFPDHMDLLKHCFDVAGGFGTRRIRVFSFYPTPGRNIVDERAAVLDRMGKMIDAARQADMVLFHENEKDIYGAFPEPFADLFAEFSSEHFRGIFDPANFVTDNLRPFDECWQKGLAELTHYFHVKDKRAGEDVCCPAGQGQGQFPEILADAKKRGWGGYMTLEPHLSQAGQFKGFTGPQLFASAVDAIKKLCDDAGLAYR